MSIPFEDTESFVKLSLCTNAKIQKTRRFSLKNHRRPISLSDIEMQKYLIEIDGLQLLDVRAIDFATPNTTLVQILHRFLISQSTL